MNYLNEEGRIETYKVQNEYDLLSTLSNDKPSKRIVKTKKGLNAIKALIDLEKNYNISWYEYLKYRNKDDMNALALFYRGNKISFNEMFKKADEIAQSMSKTGLIKGDEIGVCISNTPELVYVILAANKLGIKVNLFGADYQKDYLCQITDDINKKLFFISDNNYSELKDKIDMSKFDNVIVTSLADSLPKNPEQCDEYVESLKQYYYYEDKKNEVLAANNNAMTLSNYVDYGKDYSGKAVECGDLETDFLVTYTSGSTKIGLPKAIIHKNRSLITIGRFHDPELCGNPKIKGLRGLAHIHPDSNTNVITCISDNLIQGWSVALEPEYDMKKALDYLILNKPNYLNATTSFLLEMSKQYLMDKKYHENGKGIKLPFLLATFAVGEAAQKGEEKFINRFLRESRAGSGVSIKGLKMPFTTLSVGGGDCEHGGIYYTLWKSLYQKLYFPKIGNKELGLLPVPYVVVTALKKNHNGEYIECNYDEMGIIVANSYTNLSGYKNNFEATNNLIIGDNLGRNWVSCNVYGYIDKVGGVHVKGRIPNQKPRKVLPFQIDDVITMDTKNILSSTTVEVEEKLVTTIQFQPLAKINEEKIYVSIYNRLCQKFDQDIINSIFIRVIPKRESFPTTCAGKRNIRQLENLEFNNTFSIEQYVDNLSKNCKVKTKTLKKQ